MSQENACICIILIRRISKSQRTVKPIEPQQDRMTELDRIVNDANYVTGVSEECPALFVST